MKKKLFNFKIELDNLKDIKAKFLSYGQKKLVIALSLLSFKNSLLDECFAA